MPKIQVNADTMLLPSFVLFCLVVVSMFVLCCFFFGGCDRLALPRHVVSRICSVLLHPELLDQRLVPPHRMLNASSS